MAIGNPTIRCRRWKPSTRPIGRPDTDPPSWPELPRTPFRDSRTRALAPSLPGMWPRAVFECGAVYAALDARRAELGLGWYELADRLWQQSEELNADRPDDHPLCGGAVQRLRERDTTSCQYVLFMLRWLGNAPEDYLSGPVVDVGDVR